MSVPFYLQRPEEDNIFEYSRTVDEASFDRANKINSFRGLMYNNWNSVINHRPAPKTRPSSWKDTIDYTKGYDEQIEDKYRAEHDYLGLADYLSHFRMSNLQEQRAYENEIAQLKRYGRQYNAIQGSATREQKDAISFLEDFDNGNIDSLNSENEFKRSYEEAVSTLGRTISRYQSPGNYGGIVGFGDKDAATITVSFNDKHVSYGLWGLGSNIPVFNLLMDRLSLDKDENQFNKFAHETGYDLETIKRLLGDNAISFNEGNTVISVPKTNLNGIKLLTQIREWCNETGRTLDDVQYASYDSNSNLINDNTIDIGLQLQGLSSLLNRANKNRDDVKNKIGAGNNIVSTTVLPYMNERQMQLKRAVDNGLIDDAKYTSMLKADNEIYENLLLATDFSQLDIYTTANNEIAGDRTLRRMDDNLERGALKDYINNAISEDRVSWRAGISGGEYGTYIEVNAVDDKGKFVTDKDDSRRGMTIFIPGLFTESIQQAFNASTQGKTVAEFNSMQKYGYEYTLSNGNVISNVNNNDAKLYDKDTRTERYISREEAQNMLHQDIIIEDAARNIRNRAFNLDGTPRAGYDPKIDAKKIAIAAANELYPGSPVEENDIAVWNPSSNDIAKRRAAGNIDKDYKAQQAYNIYSELMNSIYKLLNVR